MLYAFLCYNDEDAVLSWTKDEDDAVMAKLARGAATSWRRQGKLGPVARLMPTTAATTLRKDSDPPLVIDGPFAETKEQLLGFYVIDCDDLEEALAVARRPRPGQSRRRLRDPAARHASARARWRKARRWTRGAG